MTILQAHINRLENRLRILELEFSKSKNDKSKEHFKIDHKGTKTKEVISQELKSFLNQYKPETMTENEIINYSNAIKKFALEVSDFTQKDQKWIYQQVNEFRNLIEKTLGRKV